MRPVLYKALPRFITGLVLALLWDRFLNKEKLFQMTEHAFFVLGIVFFALAWVVYLKIDGFRIHHLNENSAKPKKNRHLFKHMADYSDEEPSPDDSLDENERLIAGLLANIITGLCFLLPSVIFMLF